jgi:cell volume regulation protein A
MNLTVLFGLLGGLLVLAFLANKLFAWTRVPDVVVLIATGIVLGPVLHIARAEQFQAVTHAFGTLALLLILFEGGLDLDVKKTLIHFPGGLVFGILSFVAAVGSVAAVFHYAQRSTWLDAALVGAVLGCTSSSIVLPILQQLQGRDPIKIILLLESTLGDVFAVLTVGVLLDFRSGAVAGRAVLARGVAVQILVAVALAAGLGFAWGRLVSLLSERRFWPVLTFAVVLLLYSGTEALHASGLLAVLGFGLALANLPSRSRDTLERQWSFVPRTDPKEEILSFHSELSFLIRTFFFVLIGVVVELSGLRALKYVAASVIAAIYLSRWIAVQTSRWSWRDVTPAERELLLLVHPRGLVTVVLALQVLEATGNSFQFLPTLAFGVIVFTNLLVVLGSVRARKKARTAPPSVAEPPAAAPSAAQA